MRVKPTDHIASGIAPAGAPAGKKAPLKQTAALSGAHRHGKHTLPGLTGTGPGIDPLGLTTNVRQVTSGDGVNLHDQCILRTYITLLLYSLPPSLLSCNLLRYASVRCLWPLISHWLGSIPSSPPPEALYLGRVSALTSCSPPPSPPFLSPLPHDGPPIGTGA